MTLVELQQKAREAAAAHGLDPALFCALVHHESGWKPYAARYEPNFYGKYVANIQGISETEKTLRSTSMGLTQVMGQVAREFGFNGDYLTELFDPVTNLEFGARKLARCMDRHSSNVREALLAYNGGGDKGYPDRVLQHLSRYK